MPPTLMLRLQSGFDVAVSTPLKVPPTRDL